MSISAALSIAASGLRANQVQSNLIASNVANAQTEGYTRKSAELITRNGAVEVSDITRAVDPLLDRLDRANSSERARAETVAQGLASYTGYLGQPTDAISPSARLSELYTSLVTLSGSPGTSAAQLGVVESARALAANLNGLSTTLSELAQEVEMNIRYDVADANDALTRLGQINTRLGQTGGGGLEGADLLDEQSRLLDRLAGFMDIQTASGSDGSVNVYTASGTELLIGRKTQTISYDATQGKLTAGQADITPGRDGARGIGGGSLAGLFELRDRSIPTMREQLDGYADLLITRFSAADGSLTGNEQGLFVDTDPRFGTTDLARRITVNPDIDPDKGGTISRLITGAGSGQMLASGDISLIQGMMGKIDERAAGPTPMGEGQSLSSYVSSMVAAQQQQRVSAETAAAQAEVSGATIAASRQNLQGVNIDDELQVLMVVEQSYAANTRVLTSLQSMLDDLMNAV